MNGLRPVVVAIPLSGSKICHHLGTIRDRRLGRPSRVVFGPCQRRPWWWNEFDELSSVPGAHFMVFRDGNAKASGYVAPYEPRTAPEQRRRGSEEDQEGGPRQARCDPCRRARRRRDRDWRGMVRVPRQPRPGEFRGHDRSRLTLARDCRSSIDEAVVLLGLDGEELVAAKVFGHVPCSLGDGSVIGQNSVNIGDTPSTC